MRAHLGCSGFSLRCMLCFSSDLCSDTALRRRRRRQTDIKCPGYLLLRVADEEWLAHVLSTGGVKKSVGARLDEESVHFLAYDRIGGLGALFRRILTSCGAASTFTAAGVAIAVAASSVTVMVPGRGDQPAS